jgi:hypothetical protein
MFHELFSTKISEITETDGKQLTRIILFGGLEEDRSEWLSTTWIYYDELNSWSTMDNLPVSPPAVNPVSMTAVCNEYVILILDLDNSSTWIFWIKSKEWEEVAIAEDVIPNNVLNSANGVAVQDPSSSCHCHEPVFFVPFWAIHLEYTGI